MVTGLRDFAVNGFSWRIGFDDLLMANHYVDITDLTTGESVT